MINRMAVASTQLLQPIKALTSSQNRHPKPLPSEGAPSAPAFFKESTFSLIKEVTSLLEVTNGFVNEFCWQIAPLLDSAA